MTSPAELGTHFHTKYIVHYHKERARMVGSMILFFLILLTLPWLDGGQLIVVSVIDVLILLMGLTHYSKDAIEVRCYRAAAKATGR